MKAKVNTQVSAAIRQRCHIRHFIYYYDFTFALDRRIYFDLLDDIYVLKNHIFKIKVIITDTISISHISL